MSSETIFLYNAIAYTLTLAYMYRKYGISLGFIIWCAYTISAWSTWLFVQQPMYWSSMHFSSHTVFPCVYLFVLLVLSIMPLCKITKLNNVEISRVVFLKYILIASILVQLVFIVVDFPSVLHVFSSQGDLGALREQAYAQDGEEGITQITKNAILNRFYLFYSGIRPINTGLSVFLYFACQQERKIIKLFFFTTLLENIWHISVLVGRGEMVITAFIYASTLFLLRDSLSSKTKKLITVYILPIAFFCVSAFWAITISRFGDLAEFYMYKYMGEAMNNFCGILYPDIQGYTCGQAYFSYINRYLLGDITWTNTEERYAFIENVTHIPAFIFYTYIGGLVIEFGKLIPIIIIIFFNRFLNRIVSIGTISIRHVVIYISLIYFFSYGLFTFPIQNFVGISMIFFLIIFYFFFKPSKNY